MATPATMSSNWPYPSSSSNGNGANGQPTPASKMRSPPAHATKALAGAINSSRMSPPGTAASVASPTNTGSINGGEAGPGSVSSATSPSLGDLGNTLHSTFSSLSLNSGSTAASSISNSNNAKSPTDYTRPLPMRTPSGGSLQHYQQQHQQAYQQQQQQQQPAVQISAIGSGRSGTSPPSRSGNLDTLNENSSIVGSPSSNNALSPTVSVSQQLPPPEQHQQRHTPSHSLPWPSYASDNNANNEPSSLAFLSGPQSQQPGFNVRNSIDGNNQSSHFSSNFQQHQQHHNRQHINSDNSNRSYQSQQQQQPHPHPQQQRQRQSQQHQQYQYPEQQQHQQQEKHESNGDNGRRVDSASSSSSSSRFTTQPQFNLDHAQLAKSREQKDLDDIDSGQRASATLWMGDLEGWMDEVYIKKCITALGWDREFLEVTPAGQGNGAAATVVQTSVKMIKGASSTSGYCFITFPTSAHAQAVLAHFSKQPPMLMPGSERTFKLNWATGLPGVQPKWEGEYSIFVGDLGREVTEGELVALFTPLFQSTKSAKIMYDPTTGLSRGYGFVRFGDENDMSRSLALGQNNSGSGLSLRGRTLRISEASGSGGSRNRTQSSEGDITGPNASGPSRNTRDLHIKVPNNGITGANLLSPNATGFSIPVATPASPGVTSPPYSGHNQGSNSGSGHVTPLSPSSDPTNTTVFVGGLPACINEETLRSFFQHFGEITYVKIPPNKGCGFVQFLRRPDAELAIAKMHDFPIHGKSRIRLSWGRSQGDKQVEHVRKLANALNVPFEAVWRMVQGQDNSTIKQIASAVGGNTQVRGSVGAAGASGVRNLPGHASPADPENARAGLARLASLRNSIGPGVGPASGPFAEPRTAMFDGMQSLPAMAPPTQAQQHPSSQGQFEPHDSEVYAFRQAAPTTLSPAGFGFAGPPRGSDAGPYSRVSPSAFAPLSTSNLSGQSQQSMPLSPGSSGSAYTHQHEQHQHQQQQHHMAGYGGNFDPYTPVSIPSPVGNGGAHMQNKPGADFGASSSNFGPRSWRQNQSEMTAPNPSFQSSLPEFLTNSINGRF